MAEQKTLNGLDVSQVETVIEAIKQDPDLGKGTFRARNKWVSGGNNRTTINDYYGAKQDHQRDESFTLEADEPALLAGEDRGASPVEHLLNALASCLTSSMVYHAALRGIRLEEVESEIEGDIDLRGFLGISDEVRSGYDAIRVRFKVKTDPEHMDRLEELTKKSPVFDVTTKGTKVDVSIERK